MAHQTPSIYTVLGVTRATAINSDPGYCRATDPGMALGSSSALDVIMAPIGSTGHSDQQ